MADTGAWAATKKEFFSLRGIIVAIMWVATVSGGFFLVQGFTYTMYGKAAVIVPKGK